MSRNHLLVAAGLLLIVAATIHWSHFGAHPEAPPGPGAEANSLAERLAQPLDALVPPMAIHAHQAVETHAVGHHGDHGHGPPIDPHSLAARIAKRADFSKDTRATFEAHGEDLCASGCAASRHPTTELTREHFHELLEEYAGDPMNEDSFALESLLYFGRQTQQLLDEEGDFPLDPRRSAFLRRELKRTHASIEIRLVDEHGEVRTWLPPTRVPLDRRHVFQMEVNRVQPLITSGTVKRVGLYHLWTRL